MGIGNPILSDDGVGFQIAEELKGRVNRQGVTVMEAGISGPDLWHVLADFDKAIIIDAIQTKGGKAGQIYRSSPEAFDSPRHVSTPHMFNLITALDLGRELGLALPQQITIFAIEVKDTTTYGERFTPEVEQAIPVCVEMVIQELEEGL